MIRARLNRAARHVRDRMAISQLTRNYRPTFEPLEQRLLLYAATGSEWANTDVSASFLPDGTASEGYQSSLYALLNPAARSMLPGNINLDDIVDIFDANLVSANWGSGGGAADTNQDGVVDVFDVNMVSAHWGETSTEIWQREFARALQTWANVSKLNFHFVSDSGAASGVSGQAQGDSRFGDIRLGAHPLGTYLAYTYYPSSSTLGGDITMNPIYSFGIGAGYDIYSLLLHEAGHSLGLGHSTAGTVMYGYYTGIWTGLAADDIAGIQSIYGARTADSYDSGQENGDFASASAISLGGNGTTINADLTTMADADYYRLTLPAGSDGTLTVSVDVRNKSLLAPKLAVYDAAQNLIATASGEYGAVAPLSLSGLIAGQTYYLVADGATDDEFGMGAYALVLGAGGGGDPPGPTVPDQYETNDTFATAAYLGKGNNIAVSGLTVHDAADVDYFRFQVPNNGSYQISILFAHAAGNLDMIVYDANESALASGLSQTDNESVTLSLTANQSYYVRVVSPSAETNSYSLSIAKLGGGGGGGLSSLQHNPFAEIGDGFLPAGALSDDHDVNHNFPSHAPPLDRTTVMDRSALAAAWVTLATTYDQPRAVGQDLILSGGGLGGFISAPNDGRVGDTSLRRWQTPDEGLSIAPGTNGELQDWDLEIPAWQFDVARSRPTRIQSVRDVVFADIGGELVVGPMARLPAESD